MAAPQCSKRALDDPMCVYVSKLSAADTEGSRQSGYKPLVLDKPQVKARHSSWRPF